MATKSKKKNDDDFVLDPVAKHRMSESLTDYGMGLFERLTPAQQKFILEAFDELHFN